MLAPLNATSLRDQAYALIKSAIADTDIYNPQQELRLDERQLITALGVSRTPIREALSLLEQEGFVRTVPLASLLSTSTVCGSTSFAVSYARKFCTTPCETSASAKTKHSGSST